MKGQEKSQRARQWQRELLRYVETNVPAISVLETGAAKHEVRSSTETVIECRFVFENPLFIDVDCDISFDLIDHEGNRIGYDLRWIWYLQDDYKIRHVPMHRNRPVFLPGSVETHVARYIGMPPAAADRVSTIALTVDNVRFSTGRFFPRWGQNLAVRSDITKKDGVVYSILARENLFNDEYVTLKVTPVLYLVDKGGNPLKKVSGKETDFGGRYGRTFGVYTRVSRKAAEEYHSHYILLEHARFAYDDAYDLVRVTIEKSGYITTDAGKEQYEQNCFVSNESLEWVSATVRYSLAFNVRTPMEPIGQTTIEMAPRSNRRLTRTFTAEEIGCTDFRYINPEIRDVVYRGFHQIPIAPDIPQPPPGSSVGPEHAST